MPSPKVNLSIKVEPGSESLPQPDSPVHLGDASTNGLPLTRNGVTKSLASPLAPPARSSSPQSPSPPSPFRATLPPRKRARTKEEKEQRRVERILRNRRAAHLSREKKKRYIEFLENGVSDLVAALRHCALAISTAKSDPKILEGLQHELTNGSSVIPAPLHLDGLLEKINQNRSMGGKSHPLTPTEAAFSKHPVTPGDDDDSETEAAALSLQKLSRTPVGVTGDIMTHKPVSGLGIIVGDEGSEEDAVKIMMSLKNR